MDISTFYFTAAGAAATLMGLMFVALQFNLERRAGETRWRPIARATYTTYLMLFTLTLLELIPFSSAFNITQAIFLVIPVMAIIFQLNVWWQARGDMVASHWIHLIWLIGIPMLLYSLMIGCVFAVSASSTNPLDIQVPCAVLITMLFLTALRNSWQLVVQAGLTAQKP